MTNWDRLLNRALRGIDALEDEGHPLPSWSFGGGTALMVRYRHRNSKDVDIFIPDPQYLTLLSPRLGGENVWNSADYDEAAHYLKLRYPEGEIDFIVSSSLSDLPVGKYHYDGREVPIEHPVEIALKKLYHRAEFLKPRDIFDVAVVLTDNRTLLEGKLGILSSVRGLLVKRLRTLPEAYYRQAIEELDILAAWDNLKPSALPSVIALVDEIPLTQ